jgi:hypothetical protein
MNPMRSAAGWFRVLFKYRWTIFSFSTGWASFFWPLPTDLEPHGERAIHGKEPGRWVFIPLLLFASLGAFADMSGLNATARYALGLTGSLWTAVAL